MFGTTLGDIDRLSFVTYDGIDLGYTNGTADGKLYVLLIVDSLGYLDEP